MVYSIKLIDYYVLIDKRKLLIASEIFKNIHDISCHLTPYHVYGTFGNAFEPVFSKNLIFFAKI